VARYDEHYGERQPASTQRRWDREDREDRENREVREERRNREEPEVQNRRRAEPELVDVEPEILDDPW
jgi:hypothetical protein